MKSNKHWLLGIFGGLDINADKNQKSNAHANKKYFVHPKNTGNLKMNEDNLFFAGGNDFTFSCVDVEVWGLN